MAPVTYIPGFIAYPDAVFHMLWNELDWVRVTKARIEYWATKLGKSYTYGRPESARTYQPQPSHMLIDKIDDHMQEKGAIDFSYEGCFLNGYAKGKNALSWHSDDDPGINHSRPIAVVSVGAGRDIAFVEKPPLGERIDLSKVERQFLEPGSLLLMHAGMQDTHLHSIPKVTTDVGPRISLTYRSLLS